MPLLPTSRSATPAFIRRLAGGGELGYSSQLSSLASGGSAVGDALYQYVPPLAVPFVAVKQAAPVDAAAAFAAADKEGEDQADKLKDDWKKLYQDATKDARMTAAHRAEIGRRFDGVMSNLQIAVSQNPAYFASQSNRLALQQQVRQALNDGDIASFHNQFDELSKADERLSAAKQSGYKAYLNGRRTDYTNQQVLDAARNEQDLQRLWSVTGITPKRDVRGNLDFSALNLRVQNGNEADALAEFKTHYLDVPTSTNGQHREQVGVGKFGSEGQERLTTQGEGWTRTSNQAKVEALNAIINGTAGGAGWRGIGLSEAAQYGLYEPKAAKWDDTSLQHDYTLTGPGGQPQVVPAGSLTRGELIQQALQAGDQKAYQELAGQRDQQVNQEIANQLTTQLGLKVVNGTVTTQDVSVGGPITDKHKEDKGTINLWGELAGGGDGVNQGGLQTDILTSQGKAVSFSLPIISTAEIPQIQEATKGFMMKDSVVDGKAVQVPRTLADIPVTSTVWTTNGLNPLQAAGQPLKDAGKFLIMGGGEEVTFMYRDPRKRDEFVSQLEALKANQQKLKTDLATGRINQAQYDNQTQFLQNRATQQGFRVAVKFQVMTNEEAIKANKSKYGVRPTPEGNGKTAPIDDNFNTVRWWNDDEAMARWGLRRADTSNLTKNGLAGDSYMPNWFGRENGYVQDVWITLDNFHLSGGSEKVQNANLGIQSAVHQSDRVQKVQQLVANGQR